jgi:hypothetical protein
MNQIVDESDDEWVCPTRMVESMVADLACAQVACGDCCAGAGVPCARERSRDARGERWERPAAH